MAAEQFPDHRPDANCPICGDIGWAEVPFPVGQVENPVAALQAYDAPHAVAALPLYCRRCGFVRLHVKPRR